MYEWGNERSENRVGEKRDFQRRGENGVLYANDRVLVVNQKRI